MKVTYYPGCPRRIFMSTGETPVDREVEISSKAASQGKFRARRKGL